MNSCSSACECSMTLCIQNLCLSGIWAVIWRGLVIYVVDLKRERSAVPSLQPWRTKATQGLTCLSLSPQCARMKRKGRKVRPGSVDRRNETSSSWFAAVTAAACSAAEVEWKSEVLHDLPWWLKGGLCPGDVPRREREEVPRHFETHSTVASKQQPLPRLSTDCLLWEGTSRPGPRSEFIGTLRAAPTPRHGQWYCCSRFLLSRRNKC